MTSIFAAQALTHSGWARDVRITVNGGQIAQIVPGSTARTEDVNAGIVIPGLANVHSHAFQRVMAGHTEFRGPAEKDNFWTWRERMYALAGEIDAARLKPIASQVYSEMLSAGYTSVAEFHYLHNEPGDVQTTEAMFEAIADAAQETGIRLTYVPVLYERAGLRHTRPAAVQERFARSVEDLISHYHKVRTLASGRLQCGIGVHSLRAVFPESLRLVAATAAADKVPMHIHIAEQRKEVDECIEVLGARPVEWLLEHCDVGRNWCLVHATHIDDDETRGIAASGAVVALCPSTEANLGDGLFPLKAFLDQGGTIAIGSDSHVSINPFEELRWLEYGQRLILQERNVAAIPRVETGRSLFEMALRGGAQACGRSDDGLYEGGNADLVVLDDDSPMLVGHTSRSYLDALIFSGFTLPIDRVMVDGQWRVVNGRQTGTDAWNAAYAAVARNLNAFGDPV